MYVARILYPVKVLGPGNRIGIWVSGCNHRCKGCSNPELWKQEERINQVCRRTAFPRGMLKRSIHFSPGSGIVYNAHEGNRHAPEHIKRKISFHFISCIQNKPQRRQQRLPFPYATWSLQDAREHSRTLLQAKLLLWKNPPPGQQEQ